MYTDIEFTYLEPEQMDFIWENMRETDKRELEIHGYTDDNYQDRMKNWDQVICGLYKGSPVAVYGYFLRQNIIYFGFFSTNEIKHFYKTMTKIARIYIQNRLDEFPDKDGVILVWEKHREAIIWIKRLGFHHAPSFVDTKFGRLLYMRKYNMP